MIEKQLDDLIGAVNALGDTLFEIKQDVARLTGASPSTETPADDPAPARPAPKKQAARDADELAASDSDPVATAESVESASPEPAPTDQPTREDVVNALRGLEKAKGKPAVSALLKKHKARNLTTLEADHYPSVVAAAQEAAA